MTCSRDFCHDPPTNEKLDVVPVARLEAFRALKLSKLESFRALKLSRLESFRALKCLSLPDLVNEPRKARYIIHVPENLFKLFSF